MELFENNNNFFSFVTHFQVIFIHYKWRIATAIYCLWWIKMTMANIGLEGLINQLVLKIELNKYLTFVTKPSMFNVLIAQNPRKQGLSAMLDFLMPDQRQ